MKIAKKTKTILLLIGLTAVTLLAIALFIIIGEQCGFIILQLGPQIGSLPPMDSWLIIILSVFAPGVFISFYLLYRTKMLEVE